MKTKLLTICLLLFTSQVFANDVKCSKMSAYAKTDWASTKIYISCMQNQGNMRSADMKCSRMTAKANTDWAAIRVYMSFMRSE